MTHPLPPHVPYGAFGTLGSYVTRVRQRCPRRGAVRRGTVRYGTERYGTVRYGAVAYGTVGYCGILYVMVRAELYFLRRNDAWDGFGDKCSLNGFCISARLRRDGTVRYES